MKQKISLILALALTLSLTACKGMTPEGAKEIVNEAAALTSYQAVLEVMTIDLTADVAKAMAVGSDDAAEKLTGTSSMTVSMTKDTAGNRSYFVSIDGEEATMLEVDGVIYMTMEALGDAYISMPTDGGETTYTGLGDPVDVISSVYTMANAYLDSPTEYSVESKGKDTYIDAKAVGENYGTKWDITMSISRSDDLTSIDLVMKGQAGEGTVSFGVDVMPTDNLVEAPPADKIYDMTSMFNPGASTDPTNDPSTPVVPEPPVDTHNFNFSTPDSTYANTATFKGNMIYSRSPVASLCRTYVEDYEAEEYLYSLVSAAARVEGLDLNGMYNAENKLIVATDEGASFFATLEGNDTTFIEYTATRHGSLDNVDYNEMSNIGVGYTGLDVSAADLKAAAEYAYDHIGVDGYYISYLCDNNNSDRVYVYISTESADPYISFVFSARH